MQVIVGQAIADRVRERAAELGLPVELVIVARDGSLATDARQAEVFFRSHIANEVYERVLASAPQVRWVHTASAGVDGLLSDALTDRKITFTNSAGVYATPIAEWVLHALLMIVKHGPQMLAAQQARRWDDHIRFEELTGKTLTLLGTGGIGREIARRAAAFEMRVWGISRSGRAVEGFERIVSGEHWRDLLPATDFLVIAAPLTDATRRMIGERELALLPSRAWLINIARGAIVDEAALIAALEARAIAGAALDTFEQEPLPQESPLWTLPNVLISPHHSGSSPHSTRRAVDLFVGNLRRFVQGEPLINVVDLEAGY
ncbi:MAG TPA: D-2-hydroxyacid dehydrogenase [Herpetosiphonaceae bacterium]